MTNCPNCSTSNRDSARFCRRCGLWLAKICPNCAHQLPELPIFCDNCGYQVSPLPAIGRQWTIQGPTAASEEVSIPRFDEPQRKFRVFQEPSPASLSPEIVPQQDEAPSALTPLQKYIPKELMKKLEAARAGGAMAGERRIVTMLFCDVKGSTAAAERLDPEEWTEIINGAFEHMIKPVYQYEGTVARLMGDAILAFFGAPIAHEDDPQRAVLAGLDIVNGIKTYKDAVNQQYGIDFNVRVGINTGEVVVGTVGSDLRMEYTAMGDAINLAARMEQTAEPGTVQIAQDTYKKVAPLFVFEELGGIEVKGKEDPVLAYRVLGRKTQSTRLRGIAGIDVPLVGRDREMKDLQETFSKIQKGVGGIVGLIGDAGLGKTRLIRELKAAHPVDNLNWFETSSLSYETSQPYNLFRRLIRRVSMAAPNDPPDILREKIATIFENGAKEGHGQNLRVFESLFGLPGANGEPPLEGETFKRLFLAATRDLWIARTTKNPAVLVCDDLHWADSSSVELLLQLVPLTERVPLLIIGSFRPERKAPGWQLKTTAEGDYLHRYTELLLKPLSVEESDRLLGILVQGADIPGHLHQRILEKSAGVPYYLEEVVRGLMESQAMVRQNGSSVWVAGDDTADFELPDSLQSLLVARIDRLNEEARRTLQLASVVGRSFYYRVLEKMGDVPPDLDDQLVKLIHVNMIREAAREPEIEYSFSSVLTQEAAYRTILLRQRRQFHLQVGEALEILYPERLEELAPVLALHFEEAEDGERALKYHTLAGDAAFRIYALDEAIEHYRKALEVAKMEPFQSSSQLLTHLYSRLGRTYEIKYLYDEALKTYEELKEKAEQLGDRSMKLAYLLALGTVFVTHTPLNNPEAGESFSEEALSLAREIGDQRGEAKAHWNLLLLHRFFTGDMAAARQNGEASLNIARELEWEEQLAYTLNDLALVDLGLSDLSKGVLRIEESRMLWRKLGNLPMLADNLNVSAIMYVLSGEFEQSLDAVEEGLQVVDSVGSIWNKLPLYWNYSRVYREMGSVDLAIKYLQDAIKLSEDMGNFEGTVAAVYLLALMYTDIGGFEVSLKLCDQSLNLIKESGVSISPRFPEAIYAVQAYCYIFKGDLGVVKQILGKVHPSPQDALVFPFTDLYMIPSACRAALAFGDHRYVLDVCIEFASYLEEAGVRIALPESYHLIGRAYMGEKKMDEALEFLSKARKVSEEVGERRVSWQILAALAEIEESHGNLKDAESHWIKAKENIMHIMSHIADEDLQGSFLALPDARKVMEKNLS